MRAGKQHDVSAAGAFDIEEDAPLVTGGKIVEIDVVADPDRLGRLDLTLLDEP